MIMKREHVQGIKRACLQSPFPDGVLWVDFRNKLDESGLLLQERLQDILADLMPPGLENATPLPEEGARLERQVAERLAGKRFCIFVDNVHAHDAGKHSFYRMIVNLYTFDLTISSVMEALQMETSS